MRILKLGFFPQTTPYGPIRDILGPISFLKIFHRVIQVLKQLPGVRDTGSHNKNNEVRKIFKKHEPKVFV